MLLHKWENVLKLLFILPLLCILFIYVAGLWSFAFYFVKFLEIKNIYKILIIFSILTLILFSAYYAYYFIEDGWLSGPFFAAGLVAVPFYLWELYKIEKEEKDNALIQRMPTLQDYFNKNKKRFITNKKMFFIGLFGVFISVWQIEVPQTIVFDIAKKALKTKVMKEVFIENIDENETFFTATKTLSDCEDKNIACPFFSFKYPIYDIKARTDGKVRIDGKEKLVARIYGIAYSTSTLTRFLTGFNRTKTLRYFTNISKYKQIEF